MSKNNVRAFLLMIVTGFMMGIAAIAPGISGGAIAVVFGLYEPITEAVGTLWKDFPRKLRFLAPLGIGAALGMLLFGRLILFFFSEYTAMTCAVFVGLIVGTLPSVFRTAARDGFRLRYLVATVLCAVAVGWVTTLNEMQYIATQPMLPHGLMLLCGGILGVGSVLPGTSASFVLMALGMYEPMLAAVSGLDIPRLVLLGIGFGAAFFMLARLIGWVYKKAYGWMSFAVIGMLLGSVWAVLPSLTEGVWNLLMIVLVVGAAGLSYGLLRIKG
ncbi:MAG: DUF368 domain-containing protein [Ruminococcaceae bacterium]|nr:DUF368 domain-containing protein [Oscillospiraceae bacterium]